MRELFENIRQILINNPAFAQNGTLPPATVDMYYNQPGNPDAFEWTFPAVFVDYLLDHDNELAYIYLHCVSEDATETDNLSDNSSLGLRYLDYLDTVRQLLTGIRTPPVFGSLSPYQDSPVQSAFFHYHLLTFTCPYNPECADTGKYIDVRIGLDNNVHLKEKV